MMDKVWIDFTGLNDLFCLTEGPYGFWSDPVLPIESLKGSQTGEKSYTWGRKHTKEWKENKRQEMRGDKRNTGKTNRALKYIITHPDGTEEKVKNMAAFCREHNLTRSAMCRGSNKGFRCRKDK